jgi:hypothetical protein
VFNVPTPEGTKPPGSVVTLSPADAERLLAIGAVVPE